MIDQDFLVTSVNPAYTKMTGHEAHERVGKLSPFESALKDDPIQHAHFRESLKTNGEWCGELWTTRKGGEKLAKRVAMSAIKNREGEITQYTALVSDITKRKEHEEQIHYQANFDQLTGLPNRNLFLDRLTLAVALGGRALRPVGLMFLDLDGFKLVNNTLGHDMGDLLLKEAANRLEDCVRTGDTVARLGVTNLPCSCPAWSIPRTPPSSPNASWTP